MRIKVLIVDDSAFFRKRIHDLIAKDNRLTVVGTASNGREAVALCKQLKPDVITMDVEMPDMNGIEAVKVIMKDSPTSILMLSSHTHKGAQTTLRAIDAGAADFLTKDIQSWTSTSDVVHHDFTERLYKLGRHHYFKGAKLNSSAPKKTAVPSKYMSDDQSKSEKSSFNLNLSMHKTSDPLMPSETKKPAEPSPTGWASQSVAPAPQVARQNSGLSASFPAQCRLVVIGASTGGPAALQKILAELPESFAYPILIVQHMPKAFTSVFATRLNQQCAISVKEAEDCDELRPGVALLAPGGHQMVVDPRRPDRVRVLESDDRVTYRPSVDITYASAAKALGNKVHAIILTGMGADGADGARLLKTAGATIWAQNKESCTIYGMPQAVVKSGLADDVLDLDCIGGLLSRSGKR